MDKHRSITAIVLYAAGGAAILVSMFMLVAPTAETYGPALVGLLLGVALAGLGRACQHLSRIRALLEARG
ncbi:hypothetical protein GE253_19900 [Niveispirillum sp. SYP-B3756]|uniref:hypothetical protein n=1 Tax=Niveispirillum sp. SYP-B3756 TaxID=2662178 RepID=UPI0012913C7A|nr:hypothetical protein [Niveispirillum sp. SYP-B3756]MQP67594.1 hypothetical protein [Niveispirillum sp. SYP-B3756]